MQQIILNPGKFKKIPPELVMDFFQIRYTLNKNVPFTSAQEKMLTSCGFDPKEDPDTLYDQLSFAAQNYYFLGANPTVDCIIFCDEKVLLVKRQPGAAEGSKWAIPGGFINTTATYAQEWQPGSETDLQAALRELKEETSFEPSALKMPPPIDVGIFEGDKRDPRDNTYAWSKSHAFAFVLDGMMEQMPHLEAADDVVEYEWVHIQDLGKKTLAFDHAKILKKAAALAYPKYAIASVSPVNTPTAPITQDQKAKSQTGKKVEKKTTPSEDTKKPRAKPLAKK